MATRLKIVATLPAGAKYLASSEATRSSVTARKCNGCWIASRPRSNARSPSSVCWGWRARAAWKWRPPRKTNSPPPAEALTRIEAMADLRLEVKDPEGPMPVGDETPMNSACGTGARKRPTTWRVVTYFSNGMEPVSAHGCRIASPRGQVVFSNLPSLAAGGRTEPGDPCPADTPGNHVFRPSPDMLARWARV